VSTRTRTDWILWAQLGCALVATAHAEYTLAAATGLHWLVAGAVPGALDLYVIRALQKHKDVLPAVLVMVAANVASILVSRGVLAVSPAVLAAVGALAPLLVWRGHVLRVHAGAVSAPVLEADTRTWLHRVRTWRLSKLWEVRTPESGAPALGWDTEWLPDFLAEEVHPSAPAPCLLSEPLMLPLTQPCSECGDLWGDHPEVQRKRAALPALPSEYAPSARAPHQPWCGLTHPDEGACSEYGYPQAVSVPALEPRDAGYAALAQEYVGTTAAPSVRGLMKYANVGQDRAGRLLTHLGVKT